MYVGVSVATVWTDPAQVRPIDAPAVAAPADPAAWTAALGTPERLDLHGRVVTQALLGEPVVVDAERDGWARVVLPDQGSSQDPRGYPGWIPAVQLTAERPAGTPPLLPPGAVVPDCRFDGPGLLAIARLFLGMPYLWSGRSGYGVDCSGLVNLAHRHFGVRIPRDAHDQERSGEPVEDAAAGDLVFFANRRGVHHVGMAIGDGTMLHAPRTGRAVTVTPITDPAYQGERRTARRFR
ncbi:MAG TPA: C40 family peptidase [Mycobacteriales bacterium]|nr:C40 family peptidase [Mycobacteriales bacterium]